MKRVIRALAIVAAVTLLVAPLATGTPEYAKKEQKQCTVCHTALGKPDLNDVGKCYKERNRSLVGCEKKKP